MPDRLELHFQDYDAPPPQSDVETITSFLSASVGAVGHLLGQYDLVIGDLCVTISPDVVITVQNEVVRLGLHPDQAAHLDPLGGMAGKTLVDHEWRPVALVVGWAPGHPALWTMMAMAHELSHVLGLTIEHGLAGPTASYATIADYDGAVARAVADEYRADRFAAVLCEKGFAAIDDNGQPADIWEGRRQLFASNLDTLLDSVVPAVPDLVQAVRAGQLTEEAAWMDIRVRVSEALYLLGYLEGTHATSGDTIAASQHRAADLLKPLWGPLFAHLGAANIVSAHADWLDDAATTKQIGRQGIDEIYRSLGILRQDSAQGGITLQFVTPTWVP